MCLPVYGVILQMLTNVAGAVLLAREYNERLPWWMVARMPLTYLPYQWLLGFSACRATWRHLAGRRDWEKTDHVGAHRAGVPVGAAPAVRGFVMPARRPHAEPSPLPADRISLVLHDTEERGGSPRAGDRRRRDGIRGMRLVEGRKWR
jgi:hypothetical protein